MAQEKKKSEGFSAAQRLIDAMVSNRTVATDYNKTGTKTQVKTYEETSPHAYVNKRLSQLGLNHSDVDDNFITVFLSDAKKYLDSAESDYSSMGISNSSSVYESRKKATDDLRSRSWKVRQYLDKNKTSYKPEDYEELMSHLDAFDKASSQSNYAFYRNKRFYSQWDTEEDYNKYLQEQKDYEDLLNFDLNTGEEEVKTLEALRDEYDRLIVRQSTANPESEANVRLRELRSQYGSKEDIEALLSEKNAYLNRAKHIQEGFTLSGVVDSEDFDANNDYVSTKADNWWSKLTSDYGMGYKDLTYEYINGAENGIRDEIKQKQRSYSSDSPFSDGESSFEEKGYDHLTEDEIAIYNYYYSKDGKEKAQEYLDNIQETLNHRKATSMYKNMEEKTLLELAFGVAAGLDQFESGMKNLFNTQDDYIPATATQMASGMVREDLEDEGPKLPEWLGGASLGQAAYDTVTTTANMAPSMLSSIAANMVLPGSGAYVGNTMMFASSAGNAYQEALNLGYDKSQARTYSTLVGASEAGLQALLGGISSLGGTASGAALSKVLDGIDNAFARTALKLGGNMLSEGFEEGLQEVLTPLFKSWALKVDEDINWSEVAYSGLLGALTAGFMEGGTTIAGEVKTYQTGKQLQAADISAQRLADIGKTFSADTVAYQLAGRVNENTGAYTMGRLFNEIGATLSEQNVTEITNALVAKGMDQATAKKNAKALAYVVEGGQLSERQIAAIEANEVLAEVARTTLIEANTTWNQRSKGYNEALMALAQEKASRTNPAQQGKENAPTSDTVDTQKENGTESLSEADSVDTSPAKVQSISSIKNGQATIKLEDGSEVDVKKADLDPDDGVRIETIASIEGISATDANFILNTLRDSTNASAQMDSLGAKEAYKYGFYGLSKEHLTKHGVFANSLTDAQRQAIYETGKKARQQQIEKATPKKGTGTNKETGIYFDNGNGNVVAFKDGKKALTDKQSAGVKAAMVLKKLGIGGDIYFFESYLNNKGQRVYKDKNGNEVKAPNGWYSKDGSIHIDLNAGNKGSGFVLFTLAHELTHFIEQWSPQKYKILADFLVENYEKGQSMDKLVRAKQDKLSALRGEKVSYKEAYSEVIADSMEAMLADGNVMDKLLELKAKDNSLFMKMKQFFDNLLAKIRNIYKGQIPDSAEGRAVLEMTESIEKIQQLFADALVDASENFQAAEKNTTAEGGEKYQFRGYAEDGRGVYESNFPKGTPKKAKAARILSLIQDVWSKKPITLKIEDENGTRYITAEFDPTYDETGKNTDASKLMGGNRHGTSSEQRVTLDLADDYYQLAEESTYNYSKEETGKDSDTHKDVRYWHYFINDIYFAEYGSEELVPYRVSINVKEKTDGNFFYSFSAEKTEETSTQRTLHAAVSSSNETATNGNLFNPTLTPEEEIVKNESAEALDIEVDDKTESVSPAVFMSERTWTESDYVQERGKAAKEIAKAIGVSEKKAKAYIDSVNSIAKMIAEDRVRLDYFSSPGRSSFVSNVEYGGSFDFSTLCKKRRLLTGTFTAIQKALPNTALTANEILDIRNRMKDAGLEVSCGLCYVEGSRANMGQFAQEFLKLYKQYYPDAWQPNMADVNTPEGIEWVRINHPEAYEQYEYFWNHYGTLKPGDKNLFASQQKPKLYQLHTEYKGEILEKFNDDDNVEEKNLNGGIRLQSFSDFEIVHLIDTMQIIMDMSRVGLAGQAYTKVPDFAWALGDTGLKINLSLIAKGVDENGKLIFDDVEGMPIDTAVALRNRYSKNVGTILVAFNDEQLLAAMADERVDFIIPFHRSQWKKSQYEAMGLPAKTKDYTYMQNEKFIKPQYHEYRGRMVKDKATNYMPNEYWDFSKSGKENAEAYLEMCARNNKRPKFYKLLQNNGDGSYSLKADGSTDGYWKLLIDFKMYDNSGKGSPQMPVKPDFNMEEAQRMLNTYQGGHSNFPVAQGIVDGFVQEYKDSHKGQQFSDRDSEGNPLSAEQQEFFKDSQVRWGENLMPVYHGTRKEFTVFDSTKGYDENRVGGLLWAAKDSEYAAGYTSLYEPIIMKGYLNITNLLDIGDIDEYENYESRLQELADLVKLTPGELEAMATYDDPVKYIYDITSSKGFRDRIVELGYDGVTAQESGLQTYGFVDSNQFKNIDNLNPTADPDVRYSDRDSESVSNRSLLANAFEGLAQNDIERNKIQEYKGKISLINSEEQKLSELNEQIKELSFSKGPKDTKAIRDLQFEARQTANRINTYDKQLLRLEASKPLQDVLQREKKMAYKRAEQKGKEALEAYRERTMKTQRELLDKWQTSRKKGIDSRHRTAMRHKIKDVVNELNQYLLRGTKDRHVPIELQKAVAEALDAVNMDTVGAEERIAKLQDELMKAKTPEQIQEISRKIDHIQEMGEKMNGKLQKLKDAYDQFVNSDDPLIANSHDEVISNKLQSVIETVGDTPLRDMTLSQLEDVYDMYRMVLTTIRNANKAFKAKKSESISTIANQVMEEVEKVGGKKKLTMKGMDGIKSFGWNNLKPVYAFEHIGSDSFTEVFDNVRDGEDVWALDVTEAREFYLDKSKKHNYDSWDFDKRYKFTSTSGMDFELTLDQILSLYAYSKRDQAAEHLKKGGIVIDETTEITVKNKLGIPVKFNPTEATAYNISEETLADIISKLTNEQKSFADEMQDYLSTVMGAKGNEVSLVMYGVKLFKEKFYFPLKSAHQFMAKAKEQAQGEVKIKNSGFSKETVQKASNPIVLTPFMNVWANHVNEMSMYHAFVLPMEDFYRVYNYKTPTSDTMATESVEMFIQNAYGKGATKYIDQLLKDLNGGARTDSTTGIINKMMGLFKKGAVFASLSVVVQQPSAIARAAALLDTKYFIGPKVDHKRHKALWDEVKRYAPVAIIKEMGYFDTNMGKSTQDFILGKEYSGFSEKMKALVTDSGYRDEVLSKAPALADELAWCSIWEAVKRETKAKYPGLDIKAEPFLKLCGSRFTEVITKTQVYDSVLSRSALMRSKDTGMKMATAFMAEPTTSINMIADALLKGKRGNRKYARAAIGAVIASQILNSILVSFVYAGRDDDEDKTYLEKYIGTLTGEALDSLNPAGYIPFIKDIMSIVQGYDVERSDMAVISDLWTAWQNLSKDTVSPYRKVEGFAGSIAQIFGLPVKNIMRDVRGIYQTVMSFVDGQQTTKAGIGYAVKSALPKLVGGGDVSNQNQLYEAILSGDQTQIERVKGRYKDEKAVNSAMRSAIKDRFESGEIGSDTAVKYLMDYCGDEESDAFWKVEEWKHDSQFEEDFGKYNEFYGAVKTGKDLKAIIKKYTDNGVTDDTLKYQITDHFKPLYIEMSTAEKANIKGYLLNAMTLLGMKREDAEKKISAWEFESNSGFDYENRRELFLKGEITGDQVRNAIMTFGGKTEEEADKEVDMMIFEAEYGFAYSDRGDAYMSGDITAKELKHILMTSGGKTAEEAELQIQAYDWEAEGYGDVTTAAVREYNEYCSAASVPKDVYLHIRSFANNTDNDVDAATGKTIYYSAMKKIMAEINAQYGLTAAQKTAIARSLGWAEKNINKYKPW